MKILKHSYWLIALLSTGACQDNRLSETPAIQWDFKQQQSGDFFLPEGWQIELWAESPQFYNPTNMDVDIRGRVWVTESVNYRDFKNNPDLHFEEGDRVMILEDTDGDGKADHSKVFAQDKDLQAPLGIAVIGIK